ncbi:MAG: sensor histidine kinase [Streptosporangiaceae bacterium]
MGGTASGDVTLPGGQVLRGGAPAALARQILRAPFSARARREIEYCLVSVPLGLAGFLVVVWVLVPSLLVSASVLGTVVGLLGVLLALGFARRFGGLYRRIAARLLQEQVAGPPPFRRPSGSVIVRLDARLRDIPAWRAVGYILLRAPVAFGQYIALAFWACGAVDLTYPLWWPFFRGAPRGTSLKPVPALIPAPFNSFVHASSWASSLLVAILGAFLLLCAPWLTRGLVTLDRWLVRSLLGPGTLTQRVRDLEQARARVVDDSVARLRQVERDLHDGAQVRLAAMAMNLGLAKEKLGADGQPPDVERVRELVDAAHLGAKEALVELRELVRGIHPPVLEVGLGEALATLAAGSAIPVQITADLPARPTPAIETIAYFCLAELLANATKHSAANKVDVRVGIADSGHDQVLRLQVCDDGLGGADAARGSGLAGLERRVGTVDGRLVVDSPPGGPTRISVELPMKA